MYTNNTTTPLIYRFTKTLQKTVSTTNNFSSLYTHTRTHTHIRHTSWLCISGVVQCRMKQWDYHDDMRQQVTWPPLTSRNSLSPHLLPSFSLPHFASLSRLPLSACDVRTPPTLSLWCEDYGGLTGVRTVCLCSLMDTYYNNNNNMTWNTKHESVFLDTIHFHHSLPTDTQLCDFILLLMACPLGFNAVTSHTHRTSLFWSYFVVCRRSGGWIHLDYLHPQRGSIYTSASNFIPGGPPCPHSRGALPPLHNPHCSSCLMEDRWSSVVVSPPPLQVSPLHIFLLSSPPIFLFTSLLPSFRLLFSPLFCVWFS